MNEETIKYLKRVHQRLEAITEGPEPWLIRVKLRVFNETIKELLDKEENKNAPSEVETKEPVQEEKKEEGGNNQVEGEAVAVVPPNTNN